MSNAIEDRLARLEAERRDQRSWTVYIDESPEERIKLELRGAFDTGEGIHAKSNGGTCRIEKLCFEGDRLVFRTAKHNCMERISFWMNNTSDVPRLIVAEGAHVRGPFRD